MMEETTRQIPNSKEAESYILGSLLLDSSYVGEVVSRLSYQDFYYPENQNIMAAIIDLDKSKKEVDVASLIAELKQKNLFDASGGTQYIYDLIDTIPSVVNVNVYVDIIKEKSVERELLRTIQDISNKILDHKLSFNDLMVETEKKIVDVVNKRKTVDLIRIDTATDKVLEIVEKNKRLDKEGLTGLDTGFDGLNKLTYGFQPGELIILAARPGIGKSAFALNLATNACEAIGAHVAFFSLEMGIDQLLMRLYSSHSGLSLDKIRSGKLDEKEMAQLYAAKAKLDRFNIYLDEAGATDVEEVVAVCRKLRRESKLDFVIIDYLQLLSTSKKTTNRVDEVSRISRQIKMMARELQIPVLALSQLSRSIEKRGQDNKGDDREKKSLQKPVLSDLRESGSIEQDADIVMFLHREASITDEDTTKRYRNAKTELIIAKNRQGVTDSVQLVFKGANSMFITAPKGEKES